MYVYNIFSLKMLKFEFSFFVKGKLEASNVCITDKKLPSSHSLTVEIAALLRFIWIKIAGRLSANSQVYVSLYLKLERLRVCMVPTSWICCGFVHAAPSVQLPLQPGCDRTVP